MFKAKKNDKDSEQPSVIQYQHSNREKRDTELYQQSSQNLKDVSAINCFVSFARENSLKLIEDNKEKANKAVLYKGYYLNSNKLKQKQM